VTPVTFGVEKAIPAAAAAAADAENAPDGGFCKEAEAVPAAPASTDTPKDMLTTSVEACNQRQSLGGSATSVRSSMRLPHEVAVLIADVGDCGTTEPLRCVQLARTTPAAFAPAMRATSHRIAAPSEVGTDARFTARPTDSCTATAPVTAAVAAGAGLLAALPMPMPMPKNMAHKTSSTAARAARWTAVKPPIKEHVRVRHA